MPNKINAAAAPYKGCAALVLENDTVRMVVLPEIGGKIASLQSKTSGREFMWQDDTRPYRPPIYGDAFGNYDISGFDECFPTIGECQYPQFPWQGVTAPDHGELWCIPWQGEIRDESIYLHAYGIRFPYHFEKRISLAPDSGQYTISYRVTNLSPFDFPYLWSAHPLFAAQEGMRVILPGNPQARLTFGVGGRVKGDYLQVYRWPDLNALDGAPVDYSLIGPASLKANDKVYADSPAAGWCALHEPQSGDFVAISFSPEKIPYIGVCIDHGGWPTEGVAGYWVAVEPCTGYPDPLDEVTKLGKQLVLPASGVAEWALTLHTGQADSTQAIERLAANRQ